MTTINVSMPATAATDTGSNANSYPTDLPGLQRKLVGLMKAFKEATEDRSPGAQERAKLLQVQIQACQAQIQQLQAAQAQKAQLQPTAAPAVAQDVVGKPAQGAVGRTIDTVA